MWFELLATGNPCIAASHPVEASQTSTLGQRDTFSIQITIKENTIRVVYLLNWMEWIGARRFVRASTLVWSELLGSGN